MINMFFTACIILTITMIHGNPKIERNSWPMIKNFDIWNAAETSEKTINHYNTNKLVKSKAVWNVETSGSTKLIKYKKGKVFNLFPVPVDGECLANDGRRSGTCLNVYECRLKGGIAKGECSMGFGVCCIFLASCDQTVSNNLTYLVSPNFPSSMPNNFTSCWVKVKVIDRNVSQLRIDFNHFSLGQPNRKTGVCEGDMFNISGGPTGSFSLCGQNSGQHVYYDVNGGKYGRKLSSGMIRQSISKANLTMGDTVFNKDGIIDITLSFSNRFLPIRFWEIQITQIPFSQKAPTGCLQYFTAPDGVIQTFNFAENGRHLANQHYKSCIRQETNMCSIMYQPCDDQSFKIGPSLTTPTVAESLTTETFQDSPLGQAPTNFPAVQSSTDVTTDSADLLQADSSTASVNLADNEGSGEDILEFPTITSRKPIRGGFDILSLFRTAFSFKRYNRSSRHFFTTCSDRITMPCIIEDFVGAGMGPLPGCEPVHCGSQFCASGTKPCQIESTVTPFYLGINFGDGIGKGSAEDNIGACIRYTQMQCI